MSRAKNIIAAFNAKKAVTESRKESQKKALLVKCDQLKEAILSEDEEAISKLNREFSDLLEKSKKESGHEDEEEMEDDDDDSDDEEDDDQEERKAKMRSAMKGKKSEKSKKSESIQESKEKSKKRFNNLISSLAR